MMLSCSTVSENIMRRRRGNACTGSGGLGGLAAVNGAGARRRRSVRSIRKLLISPRITSQPAPNDWVYLLYTHACTDTVHVLLPP